MAKKTRKENPKNLAKIKALGVISNALMEQGYIVFDNEDFTANLTASTIIMDMNGIDVKIVLSTPNGGAEHTRYEREEGIEIDETEGVEEEIEEDNEDEEDLDEDSASND